MKKLLMLSLLLNTTNNFSSETVNEKPFHSYTTELSKDLVNISHSCAQWAHKNPTAIYCSVVFVSWISYIYFKVRFKQLKQSGDYSKKYSIEYDENTLKKQTFKIRKHITHSPKFESFVFKALLVFGIELLALMSIPFIL